jgi:hypothetical protein
VQRGAFKNENEIEGTNLPVLPASELQYERLPLIVVNSERTRPNCNGTRNKTPDEYEMHCALVLVVVGLPVGLWYRFTFALILNVRSSAREYAAIACVRYIIWFTTML